jgi:nitroimidazol reductase NimA-like FMN-containing flavoprotein (pyridoxamine 5'-phosphate oxidase superfamily)
MNRHELVSELNQPVAQELLRSAPLVRLAYNGPDGLPRVIPIGFHWTGDAVVICTATTSPKVRALSARPDVALTIDVGSTPQEAKAVLIRGVATLETVDGVADEYLAAASKSMDREQLAEFERQVRSVYEQMVVIRVEPQWARFYDFGVGRLPSFLAELVQSA